MRPSSEDLGMPEDICATRSSCCSPSQLSGWLALGAAGRPDVMVLLRREVIWSKQNSGKGSMRKRLPRSFHSINELTLTTGEELRDRGGRAWFLKGIYWRLIPIDFSGNWAPKNLGGAE